MARVDLDFSVVQQHRGGNGDLLLGVTEDLVETGLEVEEVGSSIEPRHHCLERVLLVEETVFVGPDDAVCGQAKISDHGINQVVRASPAVQDELGQNVQGAWW